MAPRVAENVLSYCTNCKMDLIHTIVAVKGDKIARVLCRTCKKEHAFRLPLELRASSKKRRAVKSPGPIKARSTPAEWEKAMEQVAGLPAKAYTLGGSFEAGEKVDHPMFGPGVVRRLISPNKMEVVFEEEVKVMIRGESPDTSAR
ncbi:MAG: hypothetical protein JXL84_18530 [Deltaproteobacteria bacterium]|nr:hypothetical protein [Deltaproteobacteria bacterium]